MEIIVRKAWGHEEWIVNNLKHSIKKLVLRQGFRCSMHKHNIKDETFYLLSGKVLLETEFDGQKQRILMTPGDTFHVKIGMWHRFTGLVDSEIMEFSALDCMDEDSIIKEDSGKVDLKEIDLKEL